MRAVQTSSVVAGHLTADPGKVCRLELSLVHESARTHHGYTVGEFEQFIKVSAHQRNGSSFFAGLENAVMNEIDRPRIQAEAGVNRNKCTHGSAGNSRAPVAKVRNFGRPSLP